MDVSDWLTVVAIAVPVLGALAGVWAAIKVGLAKSELRQDHLEQRFDRLEIAMEEKLNHMLRAITKAFHQSKNQ